MYFGVNKMTRTAFTFLPPQRVSLTKIRDLSCKCTPQKTFSQKKEKNQKGKRKRKTFFNTCLSKERIWCLRFTLDKHFFSRLSRFYSTFELFFLFFWEFFSFIKHSVIPFLHLKCGAGNDLRVCWAERYAAASQRQRTNNSATRHRSNKRTPSRNQRTV